MIRFYHIFICIIALLNGEWINAQSTLISSDTLIISHNKIIIQLNENNVFKLRSEKDSLVEKDYYPSDLEFVDFNEDGFMDIKVSFLSNASGIYDIFLYDKTIDFFKKVNGIQSVPEPQKIKGTEYYYSYSRSGCSDQNWDSYLFKIKDFNVEKIGNIHAVGCDFSSEKKGVFIYKYKRNDEILLKKIRLSKINNKWEFINKYWKRNFLNFI